MRLYEDPVAAVDILDRAHRSWEARRPRAPGLHASDLIYCRLKAWNKMHGVAGPAPTFQDILTWMIGNGYHEILEGAGPPEVREVEVRYVLRHLDMPAVKHGHQIATTLDLLDDDVLLGRVPTEVKSTRASSREPIQIGKPEYIEQAYTYGLSNERPDHLRVAVAYLNGNYAPPRPEFKVWTIEVEPGEYDAWEIELARRACTVMNQKREFVVPERYDWECGYCTYRETCEWPEKSKGRSGDKSGMKSQGFFFVPDLEEFLEGSGGDD